MKERRCLTEIILSFPPFQCGFIQSFLKIFFLFGCAVFTAALGRSSCGAWGLLFIAVCGRLAAVTSLARAVGTGAH